MKKHLSILGIILLSALQTACYKELTDSTAAGIEDAHQQIATVKQDNELLPPIKLNDSNHPKWLQKQVSIHVRDGRFDFIADKILDGMPVVASYERDIDRAKRMDLRYQGSVEGALQVLAARSSYAYSIDNSVLTWTRMQTKSFDVSFMPGVSSYMLGKREGGLPSTTDDIGVADVNNHQFANLQGTLSVWHDLEQTLNQLKSPQGRVSVSEATTSVTIHDYASRVRVMEEYLNQLNRSLSREVALQVQVLDVEFDRGYNFGVNWNVVRQYMNFKLGLTASLAQAVRLDGLGGNNNGGSGGFIIRSDKGAWNQTDLLINAISQQGKVSTVTRPRVVTLNNQVAEIDINTQTGYLREISTTTLGRDNVPIESVTPGKVKTGFTLYLLPKIQDQSIYLQISSTISTLRGINSIKARPDAYNSGQIEVPTVVEKRFNQRALVPTNSTLVLAGFKQLSNTLNNERVMEFPLFGGRGAKQNNVETIVLITPTILNAG